jgi:hypothetical protein
MLLSLVDVSMRPTHGRIAKTTVAQDGTVVAVLTVLNGINYESAGRDGGRVRAAIRRGGLSFVGATSYDIRSNWVRSWHPIALRRRGARGRLAPMSEH